MACKLEIRKKQSGAITNGNFFYNLVACTPISQSTPTETITDFGQGLSQTSQVIFTPEAISNKRDSPVALNSLHKGKKLALTPLCHAKLPISLFSIANLFQHLHCTN